MCNLLGLYPVEEDTVYRVGHANDESACYSVVVIPVEAFLAVAFAITWVCSPYLLVHVPRKRMFLSKNILDLFVLSFSRLELESRV
jgi:hypothetical protein